MITAREISTVAQGGTGKSGGKASGIRILSLINILGKKERQNVGVVALNENVREL